MAKDKKGFILYADQKDLFDQLPNNKAGELIKFIFSYVNDENPETKDLLINLAFTPIKQQFKRDLKKWEKTREGRSKAGKASAEARKRNKEQQEQTNLTNVESVEQTLTKSTVKDNVNVTVNGNVKDIEYIYSLYPSRCDTRKTSTGKTTKNKEQIKKLLKDHTKEHLESTINKYIEESKRAKSYIKNFGTFLNNLPDYEEEKQKNDLDEDYVYYRWSNDPSIFARRVKKEEAEKEFEKQLIGGYTPVYLQSLKGKKCLWN